MVPIITTKLSDTLLEHSSISAPKENMGNILITIYIEEAY